MMQSSTDSRCTSWRFPFKPVKVPENVFKTLDASKYTMERKFDGWRAIVVQAGTTSLWTRDKVRIEMPDNLEEQLAELRLPEGTILDGEIWNPLKRGSWRHDKKVMCKLTLWDVVRDGPRDLSLRPIEERRTILDELLGKKTPDVETVQWLDATPEIFGEVLREVQAFRDENALRSGFVHGVVLKRKGSPRRDHATRCVEHPDWLKIIFEGMSGWAPRL